MHVGRYDGATFVPSGPSWADAEHATFLVPEPPAGFVYFLRGDVRQAGIAERIEWVDGPFQPGEVVAVDLPEQREASAGTLSVRLVASNEAGQFMDQRLLPTLLWTDDGSVPFQVLAEMDEDEAAQLLVDAERPVVWQATDDGGAP